jgi:hypothetical protein
LTLGESILTFKVPKFIDFLGFKIQTVGIVRITFARKNETEDDKKA